MAAAPKTLFRSRKLSRREQTLRFEASGSVTPQRVLHKLAIRFAIGGPYRHFEEALSKLPLQILILSDGKAGHENQAIGLAEAMSRRVEAEYQILRLEMGESLISRIRRVLAKSREFSKPGYVIGAGHGTHLALMCVARKYDACSIVLMKPGFPMGWFGWCIAPEHDFKKPPGRKRVITSKGALNRVVPFEGIRSGRLFLIGGPSKIHGYDEAALIEQIRKISASGGWQVADSRRTPGTFLSTLEKAVPGLEIFPHQQTGQGWLAERLSMAEEVWVTEDSVSMIYEALTGGARVGVLEMPRLRQDARVLRGLEKLRAEGYFIGEGNVGKGTLAEADRCAGIILNAEM